MSETKVAKRYDKAYLQSLLDDPNDKLIAVDMDGTLCHGEWWGAHHPDPEPNAEMVKYVYELYKKGAHIIIYTARQPKNYAATHGWLVKHEVPFHGICMTMKPGADLYIDDKAMHVDDIKYD